MTEIRVNRTPPPTAEATPTAVVDNKKDSAPVVVLETPVIFGVSGSTTTEVVLGSAEVVGKGIGRVEVVLSSVSNTWSNIVDEEDEDDEEGLVTVVVLMSEVKGTS